MSPAWFNGSSANTLSCRIACRVVMTIMHILCDASTNFDFLSARHFRAARVLLSWSQSELADRAHVVRRTIVMLEKSDRRTQPRKAQAVLDVLLAAGIRFTCSADGEVSVIDATSKAATCSTPDMEAIGETVAVSTAEPTTSRI